jgi:hypothetical protein
MGDIFVQSLHVITILPHIWALSAVFLYEIYQNVVLQDAG